MNMGQIIGGLFMIISGLYVIIFRKKLNKRVVEDREKMFGERYNDQTVLIYEFLYIPAGIFFIFIGFGILLHS